MLIPILFCAFIFLACDKSDNPIEKTIPEIKQNIDGKRIAWDYSSMVKIAPANGRSVAYCGYARLIQVYNGNLACVYETSQGNIELVFSNDFGETWDEPQIVFKNTNNIKMAVPDIIELSDNSLLVACNPRPQEPYTDDRKFGIKVIKSSDGGENWDEEQLVYEAQSTFNNGCWEPSMVQLPCGEVQLFFANEGEYIHSDEQNISMLRSLDYGETWTEKTIIAGFRQGRRDGMPVPLLLADKGEILVAVEDNKVGEFKPTIYHEKLVDNWSDGYISATDSRRDYHPLKDQFSNEIYAGAPYLTRLNSGEVLLSYQSTWNRSNIWDRSSMVVEIGNNEGTDFSNRSVPFEMPITKWGLWNSITVIEDGTIPVALTSTNAYAYNSTEVWMIKGHVIPEYASRSGSATINGELDDACWEHDWPYFIGHKSNTNMSSTLCTDENYVYVGIEIRNAPSGIEDNGKIIFQIDTERKGYEKPHEGIFSFECDFNNQITLKEGSYGEWVELDLPKEIHYQIKDNTNSYQAELAIPRQLLNGLVNKTLGVNFDLSYSQSNGQTINESIPNADVGSPYTWCIAINE